MQNIVSKGKNVEEAIHLGLKLMEVNKQEVDIEVIQQETKGFVGIGRKEAVVRLSLAKASGESVKISDTQGPGFESLLDEMNNIPLYPKNDNTRQIEKQPEHHQAELEGKAWVKEQQLFVRDTEAYYPTVTIDDDIAFYKNDSLVNEKSTIVSQKDKMVLKVESESVKSTDWKMYLDPEGLHVFLEVEPGWKIIRTIKDVEPDNHITLTIEETKEAVNNLTYEKVLAKLEELRVTFGINHTEIVRATSELEPGKFEIAAGKPAEAGKNGWIEAKVELTTKNGLVEDEAGKVDFRESHLIPTVDKGKVVAIIHPPIPGVPGTKVTNEPLPAKQTYPVKINAGKGMVQVDNKLVALESGRPSLTQRGQLVKAEIVQKLIHKENVNLSTGNIRFTGDVDVWGEIEENMEVEAGGDIFVYKSVSTSRLTTSQSIAVKGNVINSELAAGKNNMLTVELGHLLENMQIDLEKMIMVIRQLMQSPAFKSSDFSVTGLQPLITILLEKKFKNFAASAKNYQEVVQQGRDYLDHEGWLQIAVSIKQIFLTLSNQVTTLDRLTRLSQQMEELAELSKTPIEPEAYITIVEAINSSLYSSGDIQIIGKGCINTKVHAGGHLKVTGVVRGGELYGRLGANIYEAGTNSGTKTIISVPKDQKVSLTKGYVNTIIKIGNVTRTIEEDKQHIIARLDENNQIIFE
ncbi:FapA family protein [Virgibacillus senegalensis]|uniref:FapA family protein n=1 Tax=Virgibacillus senegalensis TaxID=1499679 RepID=UPI00069E066C|nr:FapA family protein [Virgibacillus senegalensis]